MPWVGLDSGSVFQQDKLKMAGIMEKATRRWMLATPLKWLEGGSA